MKRTLISLLVVVFLATGAAFGLARWLRCRGCAAPSADLRELNLTPDQAAAVGKLDADFQKRLGAICAAHCAARGDLAAELSRPAPDEAKSADFCRRMCAAQADSERLALEHILKVRALLTPEQQRQHAALVRQQLTGSCPMRLHRP